MVEHCTPLSLSLHTRACDRTLQLPRITLATSPTHSFRYASKHSLPRANISPSSSRSLPLCHRPFSPTRAISTLRNVTQAERKRGAHANTYISTLQYPDYYATDTQTQKRGANDQIPHKAAESERVTVQEGERTRIASREPGSRETGRVRCALLSHRLNYFPSDFVFPHLASFIVRVPLQTRVDWMFPFPVLGERRLARQRACTHTRRRRTSTYNTHTHTLEPTRKKGTVTKNQTENVKEVKQRKAPGRTPKLLVVREGRGSETHGRQRATALAHSLGAIALRPSPSDNEVSSVCRWLSALRGAYPWKKFSV